MLNGPPARPSSVSTSTVRSNGFATVLLAPVKIADSMPCAFSLICRGYGIANSEMTSSNRYPRIGWLYTAPGVGTLIGPTLAGYAFDRMGSYDAPILGAALLSFAGAGAVYLLARSRRWAG